MIVTRQYVRFMARSIWRMLRPPSGRGVRRVVIMVCLAVGMGRLGVYDYPDTDAHTGRMVWIAADYHGRTAHVDDLAASSRRLRAHHRRHHRGHVRLARGRRAAKRYQCVAAFHHVVGVHW